MTLTKSILLGAALAAIASGCVYSHRAPATVYYAPVPMAVAPTSDRPAARVYSVPPGTSVVTPPSSPPSNVSAADLAIAESVSQLLKADVGLAAASRNVEATVDHRVVTLRGSVPTDHNRDEIVERVSRVPGVVRVKDQLGVDLR